MATVADKVVSHDPVTGVASSKTAEDATVYQVEDGRFTNIDDIERQLR